MPDETQEILQTPAPDDAALFPDEAAVLRAADAWQVKGFSVADAVQAQTTFSARVNQLEVSKVVAKAYWEANHIPYVDLNRHRPEASAIAVVPAETARLHRALPIRKVYDKLWVAMENPLDVKAAEAIQRASQCEVIPLAGVPMDAIGLALTLYYQETETPAMESRASENGEAELVALVRDLQNEVRELKQEVQDLKKQFATQQPAPPTPNARPVVYPTSSVFRATSAVQHPPFPLFRD